MKLLVGALFFLIFTTATAQSASDQNSHIDSKGSHMKSELRSKLILTLSVAQKIAAAAEAEAKKNGWDVSIAVMDDAARLICFLHMDNANNASSDIAIAKARHAINYRRDTKFHEDVVAAGHNQVLAFPNVLPVEGGIRLIVDDVVIGAIGVSGVQSPQDGQIARAGADLLAKP